MTDEADEPQFDALLEYLRRTRGFNFGGYKRGSVMRRIRRRMQHVGLQRFSDYVDYLEVHPEEFRRLFDTILINVTEFFRDPAAWDALSATVIPRLLAGKAPNEPIRVWSAGCATGAEAYTLALVLAESLGIDQFRQRVKIYATDLDETALAKARLACYDAHEVQGIAPRLLETYFVPSGPRYAFHKELRRAVIFGRHDLIQDAPISRVDLLVCRNTLMYFNTEAQARTLDRFHFALNEGGHLFLGKAETLLSYSHIFAAVDIKRRIFAKVSRGARRARPYLARAQGTPPPERAPVGGRVRELACDQSPFPMLAVDATGALVLINEPARRLFGLAADDLGRPLQDLQVSYRPVDLRSCIDRAYAERQAIGLSAVQWPGGEPAHRHFDIHVVPLLAVDGTPIGAAIALADVSEAHRTREDLLHSTLELQSAQEELQSANEELETTNEELQSTNEELETTNEELQSTNEELETINEELQSTNEELEAVNEELRQRSDELNEVNLFLESVLSSLNSGVVVLDRACLVRAWNGHAEDLWGLRADEVCGKGLFDLDIGLPLRDLRPSVQACLDGQADPHELVLSATNRRGRAIRCKVTSTPMRDGQGIRGAVLVMDQSDGDGRPNAPSP